MTGARRLHRLPAACVALLGAAVAAALVCPVQAAPAGDLRTLVSDYVRVHLERHPETGTAMGMREYDRALTVPTPATRAADRGRLASFEARLAAIPREALPAHVRFERDLLESRLAADRFALDVDRTWERDPGAVLRRLREAIAGALAPGRGECARLEAAARRLREVPELLRGAMVDLAAPEREATARAIEDGRALAALHRAGFGAGREACRESRVQADFAEADTTSLRAVEAYVAFLESGALPRSRPRAAWGPERLAAWLAATQRERTGADTLLQRARGEVAALRAVLEPSGVEPAWGGAALPPVDSLRAHREATATPRARRHVEVAGRLGAIERLAVAEGAPTEPSRRAWRLAVRPEALEPDPARLAPEVARDFAWIELARVRRLAAALALQRGTLDPAAAAAWLVAEALATPADAAREVATAWSDPATALEDLRAWRVREARDEAAARLGTSFDAAGFAEVAGAVGPLPSGLLRDAISRALDRDRPRRGH